MQMENGNVDPPESPICGRRCSSTTGTNGSDLTFSGCDGKRLLDNSESFYKKLSELYESSGLNLVLNVRETLVNLHVLYKEVTIRGGFYQVTKDKRWEEVAIALKLEGIKMKFPSQLQNVYALFLFQFEQIYFYRAPEKKASDPGHVFSTLGNGSMLKRKNSGNLSPVLKDEENVQVKKKKIFKDNSRQSVKGRTAEQKLSPLTPSKPKETKSSPGRPRQIRTAYQIFLKRECERLKGTDGNKLKAGQSYRAMADYAWRNLSETDRQPYIDESNNDKETYSQQMDASKDHNDNGDNETKNNPVPEGDYHVKPEFEKPQLPDQSAVDEQCIS
ncbi:putative high mobility group B protein 11 isoform X2 [Morus notabilis]|nr:putative high mobility group B protein 11 isoform X2 [Morus notabilis]